MTDQPADLIEFEHRLFGIAAELRTRYIKNVPLDRKLIAQAHDALFDAGKFVANMRKQGRQQEQEVELPQDDG